MAERRDWALVYRHVPLLASLTGYDRQRLRADLVAGLTTAVLLVPQGMAYALLAGLPPVMGLYAALIPAFGYAFLGTSRQLSIGPVAMDSLLVAAGVGAFAQAGSPSYVEAAILLALLVGAIQFLLGVLRMGFLVNFLSLPVMSGFTSAAAILIGLSQLKHLLGVELANVPTAWGFVAQVPQALAGVSALTLGVGLVSLVALALFKRFLPKVPAPLVVVSVSGFLVGWLGWNDRVAVVGDVPAGLPPFSLSRLDLRLITDLLPVAVSIALVAFMESIAVAKTYARKNKYSVSANRELIALGASNMLGSLFSGFPVAGGFSRTAVNASAGARTQVASLVTLLLVGLSLLLFTRLFFYLPKAALSAIIMVAVASLIDFREVRRLRRIKRSDLVLLLITFGATLGWGAATGLGVGVFSSLAFLIYRSTRPHVAVLGRVPGTTQFRNLARHQGLITYRGILIVRLDAQFYFGNVQFLKETLADLESSMEEPLRAVILDASAINAIDSSGEAALGELLEEHVARGVELYLSGVKGPVWDVIVHSGLSARFGSTCRCLSVHEALSALQAEAQPPTSEPKHLVPSVDKP